MNTQKKRKCRTGICDPSFIAEDKYNPNRTLSLREYTFFIAEQLIYHKKYKLIELFFYCAWEQFNFVGRHGADLSLCNLFSDCIYWDYRIEEKLSTQITLFRNYDERLKLISENKKGNEYYLYYCLSDYFQGIYDEINWLFRQSNLFWDKWENKEYRYNTIFKAIIKNWQ